MTGRACATAPCASLAFAGAFRRSELARIAVEHLEVCEHGLRITLPVLQGRPRAAGPCRSAFPLASARRARWVPCPLAQGRGHRHLAGLCSAGSGFPPDPRAPRRTGCPPTLSAGRRSIPGPSHASSRPRGGVGLRSGESRRPEPQARRPEHRQGFARPSRPAPNSPAGTPRGLAWRHAVPHR